MTTREFQQRSGLRIFLSYFRPHRSFLLDMACALCISLIDLAFPTSPAGACMSCRRSDAYRTFFAVMAVVLLAFAVRAGMQYVIGYWGHTFGILVEADIRRTSSATCRSWTAATLTATAPASS